MVEAEINREYVANRGSFEFIFTAISQSEEQFIHGIKTWFESLKSEGHWKIKNNDNWQDLDDVAVSAVYPNEKVTNNQVTVELYGANTVNEGFANNKRTVIFGDKELIEVGASFKVNAEIKCLSNTRIGVSRIADAIFMGLQTEIGAYLDSCDITIPAMAVKIPSKITKSPVRDAATWEVSLVIEGINITWKMIREQTGDILKQINIIRE